MTIATPITNALTIDVEDYFQVSALAPHFPRQSWESVPCRVERNVDLILGMLDAAQAKSTFFTLGWVAERFPQLVRRIADGGHELASHGYSHERASAMTPDAFLADISLAKAVLEDISGRAVTGYRAASFSIRVVSKGTVQTVPKTPKAINNGFRPIWSESAPNRG